MRRVRVGRRARGTGRTRTSGLGRSPTMAGADAVDPAPATVDQAPAARRWPLRVIREPEWTDQEPSYRQADPRLIGSALGRALGRPSGNWFVFAASASVGRNRPFGFSVAGRELVAWRDRHGRLRVGPGACPHLGAPLADAVVAGDALVCRWHGLRLSVPTGDPTSEDPTSEDPASEDPASEDWGGCVGGGWRTLRSHDDGILAWVRLDRLGGEPPSPAPLVPRRPADGRALHSVATVLGRCETRDVLANRLDPWHGAWLHPYAFTRLRVLAAPPARPASAAEDRFLVEVTFRVARRWGAPVLAEFTCPGPRTVLMRIVEGEGSGSVVETHATPCAPGPDGGARTAVIEATVATSPRPGFELARRVAPLVRPLMRRTSTRLWRDDIAYAERRYALRVDAGERPR